MSETYLLDGIRVVELVTFVFGPAAGTILGDFGADVVHHSLIARSTSPGRALICAGFARSAGDWSRSSRI